MGTPCFYTNEKLLPQSQSPQQLSAWLSGKHPGYDLVAWCFYGYLINETPNSEQPNVEAVAYMTQFIQSPSIPQLEGIGIRPFQSEFSYNGASTNGYLISGDVSPFLIPAVTVTSNPWSVVVSYAQGSHQSTNCMSVIEGQIGSVGATYMMTADVTCVSVEGQMQKLRAEIVFVDAMGIIAVGYGPSSFSPGVLTLAQATEIKNSYGDSVREYLKKKNAPLTNQGSYYYSAPLLEVKSFKIIGKNGVLSEGSQGTLWMDYVVQSFLNPKDDWRFTKGAIWHWFAFQFPKNGKALVFTHIEYPNACELACSGSSDCEISPTYVYATLYNSSTSSEKLENGALLPEKEWNMSEIKLSPDHNSAWTSPHSKKTYYLKYTLSLGTSDAFTLQAVRDDQEIYVDNNQYKRSVYEGVFSASGTINGESYSGYAWGEINTNDSGNTGTQDRQHCCTLV